MQKTRCFVLLFAAVLATTAILGAQQRRAVKPLTAQDYIDIQQLSARYAFAIDTCTNGGADYADLYTDDGEFSISQQWGVAGNRTTKTEPLPGVLPQVISPPMPCASCRLMARPRPVPP